MKAGRELKPVSDTIASIGIDKRGRLYVTPSQVKLNLIERESVEVGWDKANARLIAPEIPARFALALPQWWFVRILEAAKLQGFELKWTRKTHLDASAGLSLWRLFVAYLGTRCRVFAFISSTRSAAVRVLPANEGPTPGSFAGLLQSGFPVITLRGDIDLTIAGALKDFLSLQVPADSKVTLFDFREVTYLDSSGLGALLQHLKRPRRGIFVSVPPSVLKVFQMSNWKGLPPFECVPEIQGALRLAKELQSATN